MRNAREIIRPQDRRCGGRRGGGFLLVMGVLLESLVGIDLPVFDLELLLFPPGSVKKNRRYSP
jgi:hypothetical protein